MTHYFPTRRSSDLLIVSAIGVACVLLGLLLAWLVVGVAPPRFVRAMIPTLAVALSTQSSLACLPAMLEASKRSEEHTSELPSLMRISYAVFGLQKNITTT